MHLKIKIKGVDKNTTIEVSREFTLNFVPHNAIKLREVANQQHKVGETFILFFDKNLFKYANKYSMKFLNGITWETLPNFYKFNETSLQLRIDSVDSTALNFGCSNIARSIFYYLTF